MRLRIIAAAGAFLCLATACSSAKNDSTTATTSSSSSATSATGGATSSAGAGKVTVGRFSFPGGAASGTPVKIGLIASESIEPTLLPGAQAAVKYVNQELGGIGGHPIELVACDEKADPAAAAACSQQMISSNVAGVIGYPIVWGAIGGAKAIGTAKIGYYGTADQVSITQPNGYPLFGGSPQTSVVALAMSALKLASLNIMTLDNPLAVGGAKLLQASLESHNIAVPSVVQYKLGAADLATPVTQLLKGNPPAIYFIGDSADLRRSLVITTQAGYKGKIFVSSSSTSPGVAESIGNMKGVLADTGQLLLPQDTNDPEAVAFQTAMAKYDKASDADNYAEVTFSQIVTLTAIGNKISGDITGSNMLDAVKNAKSQPVFIGYQLDSANVPKVAGLDHLLDTYNRVVQYDGTKWNYVLGWSSAYVDGGSNSIGAGGKETITPPS